MNIEELSALELKSKHWLAVARLCVWGLVLIVATIVAGNVVSDNTVGPIPPEACTYTWGVSGRVKDICGSAEFWQQRYEGLKGTGE